VAGWTDTLVRTAGFTAFCHLESGLGHRGQRCLCRGPKCSVPSRPTL